MAMPDIKPEVNKEPEKKRGGLLWRLFGGAEGSGGGLGGLGTGAGGGGLGSVAAGGGILATKAGLLALVLVGSTVAGGIGLVGYRLFGPGQEQGGNSDNLNLFAPKPKEDANAAGQTAPKDGSSASLDYLAKANPSAAGANGSGEAPKDDVAANAAKDASVSAGAGDKATGPINKTDSSSGSGASKSMLKNVGKFGALSNVGGGGGSGAVATAAPVKAPGDSMAQARKGNLSGPSRGNAAAGGSSRALASRRMGTALGQAFGARGDNQRAMSSAAGGRTYDGSAPTSGGNIGGGSPIGGGAGDGASPAQAKSMPNAAGNNQPVQAPPNPPMQDMAPWQNAIKTAQGLLALGGIILFAMSKLQVTKATPWTGALFYILGAMVAMMGAFIISLGAKMKAEPYAQTLQGNVLMAAGAGLTLAAIMAMASGPSDGSTTQSTNTKVTGSETDTAGKTTTTTTSGGGGIDPYVLIGGGAVLIGIAGTMMIPPKKYPSKDFNNYPNGMPPDTHFFGYRELPSESALKKMIA